MKIDGQTLMNTALDTPRFIVPSLIPTGLHIIGGSPKVGKSWLMLWLCLNVAKGECLWNYQCRKGTTLYLCLEDSYDRIQSRLLDITEDAPANLFFTVMAESLDSGLPEQIENFVKEHPDTVLIVVDTLKLELDSETHIWKLIGQTEDEQITLTDEVICINYERHFRG